MVPLEPQASLEPLSSGPDPFQNDTPWSMSEILLTILVGVTLFPIRFALLVASVLFGWPFVTLSALCLTPKQAASRPFSLLRRILKKPMALSCRGILLAFGFWWIKRRRSRSGTRAGIIVSNHISLMDVFYHISTVLPSALSKMSVASIPIIATGAMAMQTIFVDRKSMESRQDSLDLLRMRSKDERYPPILIFPEGTTTNGKQLLRFKRGAFVPGITVQPVVIRYPSSRYNPADTGRHSGIIATFNMMFRLYNTMEVIELEPYSPTEAERQDPALFASNVRKRMATALRCGLADHSMEDFIYLFDDARVAKVPQTFSLRQCREQYGLNTKQVSNMLKLWPQFDSDQDGLLTLNQVHKLLRRFASSRQLGDGIVGKACLAAHACTTSSPSVVPADWAVRDLRTRPTDSLFDFPTAIHARALIAAHGAGFGTGLVRRTTHGAQHARGNDAKYAADGVHVQVNPAGAQHLSR